MNTPTNEPTEPAAGRVLGRYELLLPIAAGGMAQVWAARLRGARQFQRIVAIKTMLPQLSEDPQFEQMFLDEASLASQVRHPNVVETLDLGEQDGVLYLVMEMIEGIPLNQLMKAAKTRGGIPPAIAARIALHACAGLHAAHELHDEKGQLVGLVHRDVSPQNLLVTFDGVTKVVDFGVAKATALGGGATVAGQVKGKVSYMAPEQIQGEGLDRRADVFALGIVLYALTTGKHPFRRDSEAATMYNICSAEKVLPPSRVVPDYPLELEPIVLRALEKDRNARFSTCDEMLRALDSLPAHLRISSDADLSAYVKELFGDQRIERKRRIDEAIQRADQLHESGEWSNVSPAIPLTGIGRQSLGSLTGTNEVTGIPSLTQRHAGRNRLIGALGLLVLGLSGVLLYQLTKPGQDPAPAGLRVIEAPERPLAPEPPPEPAPTAEIPTDVPTTNEEPVEPSTTEKDPAEKPVTPPTSTTKKPTTTQKPATKPTTTKKNSDSWKYEAGF